MADDTHKMLRTIINGQSAMKSELLGRISKLQTDMDKKFEAVDKLGLQIANLEEDAPTIEEFDKLEARVKKVEVKVASV
jgi:chromosome segregation ATPase